MWSTIPGLRRPRRHKAANTDVPVEAYELNDGFFIRDVEDRNSNLYQDFHKEIFGVSSRIYGMIEKHLGIQNFKVEYLSCRPPNAQVFRDMILISCNDPKTQTKIRNLLRKPLQKTGYVWTVEINVGVFAASMKNEGSIAGNEGPLKCHEMGEIKAINPSKKDTLCGLDCIASKDGRTFAKFTLGGLISAGGDIFGLTSAHSLVNSTSAELERDRVDNGEESTYVAIGSVWRFESHRSSVENDRSLKDQPQRADVPPPSTTNEDSEPSMDALYPYIPSWDWALLTINPDFWKPNLFNDPNEARRLTVNEQISDPDEGEVIICLGNERTQVGRLLGGFSLIRVEGAAFRAKAIIIKEILDNGISGAWVLHDGKLCGYIFYRETEIPWVYMLPIKKVFERISQALAPHLTVATAEKLREAAIETETQMGGSKYRMQQIQQPKERESLLPPERGKMPPLVQNIRLGDVVSQAHRPFVDHWGYSNDYRHLEYTKFVDKDFVQVTKKSTAPEVLEGTAQMIEIAADEATEYRLRSREAVFEYLLDDKSLRLWLHGRDGHLIVGMRTFTNARYQFNEESSVSIGSVSHSTSFKQAGERIRELAYIEYPSGAGLTADENWVTLRQPAEFEIQDNKRFGYLR